MDFLDASGEGTRATVMEELTFEFPETVRRERDMTGEAGVLEAVREARDRRERPGGMMKDYVRTEKKVRRVDVEIVC